MIYLVVAAIVGTLVLAYCGHVATSRGMPSLGPLLARDGADLDVLVGILGGIVGAYCFYRRFLPGAAVLLGIAYGVVQWQLVQRAQIRGATIAKADRDDECP